jgi:hypothetical protein
MRKAKRNQQKGLLLFILLCVSFVLYNVKQKEKSEKRKMETNGIVAEGGEEHSVKKKEKKKD